MRMMTHFKGIDIGKRLSLCGAIFFMCCCGIAAEQSDCVKIFENNKEKILAANCSAIDGYIFSVGRISSHFQNKEVGFSKAKLNAISNIPLFAELRVSWPPKMPIILRKNIWSEYVRCASLDFTSQKNTIVFRQYATDRYTVVIAVPEKNISTAQPSYDEIKKTILSRSDLSFDKVHISVCIELSEKDIPETLIHLFSSKISNEYGVNVGQMILGHNAISFTCRNETDIDKYSVNELFMLLEKSPYDPEICFFLGEKLRNTGYPKIAMLFWKCGSVAKGYNPEFSKKCIQELNGEKSTLTLAVLPEILFIASAGKANFDKPSLAFLNYYAGMLPIGISEYPADDGFRMAQNAFSHNQLAEAYNGYCNSVSIKVTFEGCNMAGNAGRRIGYDHEAIALLLQATVAEPTNVYPWVHLAWIYKKLKLTEQEIYCISRIKNLKQDKWSSEQLQLLTE